MEIGLRQTAYRLWIADLLKGEFVKSPGEFHPNYLLTRGLNVSRVNLIGAVVSTNFNDSYCSLVIDDGSGAIALRAWKEAVDALRGFSVGEFVIVVGKIRSFNNVIYVVPEFIRKLENPEWARYRKLELERRYGASVRVESELKEDGFVPDLEAEEIGVMPVQEERVFDSGIGSKRSSIISLIEKENSEEGADVAVVISKSGLDEKEAQQIIDELVREGEVFEVKPGRVRTLV